MGRQRGAVLILVLLIALGLMAVSAVSIDMTLSHSVAQRVQLDASMATQIADSASAQALARIKNGGYLTPMSGGGAAAQWVNFSTGQFYYYTTFDEVTEISTVRAWGRVPADPTPSTSTAAPDSSSWDGTGWLVRGVEITVRSSQYIPQSPLFFGNGGIERPLGGIETTAGTDPADPSTWNRVTSGPSSYQASSVPFECSALDHPQDFLYNGGAPAPVSSYPHPYAIWSSQNPIGQANIEAWFANSAGAGADPTTKVTPSPTGTHYETSDPTSPDYPYPVDPNVPDVQSYTWDLWNKYKNDASAPKLGSGSHSGTYGDLTNPLVTFVTGELQVDPGQTFRGAGILVIRDDYDPNVSTNNTPSTRAWLDVQGTFEWTGLVIVAGWAPTIDVATGGSMTVVGALFGEDSVQSGGEPSLDSATIILTINGGCRVLYSNALFAPGGAINSLFPRVNKEVVGIREL